ncbi:glycosyltransferase family 4 protein [Leptolyngbya sp. FACHB-17]|uniref:glycosyltransferase family 4 protein n=1 Tax=unclassified Leptolyngbya TaxID=2650499 RepID=UPI001680EBC7|nr:glycosyltransferase family 4 protein [Leptolyngbya sp. FACHB-17]MBD2078539.1 glycosyltransferase family 4 protein [Leptolyngbya sp. FACHB-17]
MRILHVLNHAQDVGNGIVNAAIDLACWQAQAGLEVAIISSGGEYESLMKQYRIRHFTLKIPRSPLDVIKFARTFREITQIFLPDVVHAHMVRGVISAKTLRGNSDYVLVSTVHNEWQFHASLMGIADRVIAVSRSVARSMQHRGIPLQKLHIVANGTIGSPRRPPLDHVKPLSLQHPAITTVAGLYPRKGIRDLLEAFVQVADESPTAHLYLVGNGPHRAAFERQAQQSAHSGRIHFEGFQTEPQRYLLSTDIFVLASRQEPFGLALSEAREAGCAIVASNVDGIPEVLEGGNAGQLVRSGDVKALSQALLGLLRCRKDLESWKHRAQTNLDWLRVERVHQETLEVYQAAIAEMTRTVCA